MLLVLLVIGAVVINTVTGVAVWGVVVVVLVVLTIVRAHRHNESSEMRRRG